MIIYCLKCKQKTETLAGVELKSSNGRSMIKGTCYICGCKKSVFLSSTAVAAPQGSTATAALQALTPKAVNHQGKGFDLNNLINNLPIEFHQYAEKGEYVPGGSFNDQQKYSFCGPGTRYEQRIREGYQGINELDKMCKLHDRFYNENKDTKDRNISDVALAHRADEIARDLNFDDVQRKDAKFISGIMKTKAHLGFGVKMSNNPKSKNSRRRPGTRN